MGLLAAPEDTFSSAHLALFEDDVLARHGIILPQLQLFRHGARILFRHIKVAGVSSAYHFDKLDGRLRHNDILNSNRACLESAEDNVLTCQVKRRSHLISAQACPRR